MAGRTPAKHWVFTLNDVARHLSYEDVIDFIAPHCDYLVFQEEEGEEKTKHYQGYCEFKKPERLSSIQKFHATLRPHWEKRRGSRDQARAYAMKEETRVDGPWEAGDKPWSCKGQGKRTDLHAVCDRIKEGATDADLWDEFPSTTLRYLKLISNARNIRKPTRVEDLSVVLLFGKPGTGKTRAFWDLCEDGWEVPTCRQGIWWTGYQGEKNVLIDDYDGGMALKNLLKILDRYPINLETKGGHVWWCPDLICITTNVHPWGWYDYAERTDSYAALKRRFHKVVEFTEDGRQEILDVEDFFENLKPTHTRFDKTHFDGN
nr:rep protein [Cressdnaviricota sp.]